MTAAITDTQGIVAIAAAALAVVALIACAALAMAVRRLQAFAEARDRASDEIRDVVAHAADMQDAFEALRGYVEDIAARLDGRLAGAETALHGAIAHRALVRYDAYNELSGQQSMSIALLDDAQLGNRAVVHPSSRPGAGVCQAGARRTGRARALARGGRGGALALSPGRGASRCRRTARRLRAARGRASPRVGYLGPEGTFTEEALLASAEPSAVEPVALRTIYDTILALKRGEVEWAVAPIENSLDGSVSVTLDLLGSEEGGLQIVGEALLAVRHSLIASEEVELQRSTRS